MNHTDWTWVEHLDDADYAGRLRSVWHAVYGRGPVEFEDAVQDAVLAYATSYADSTADAAWTRRTFWGLLMRLTVNTRHEHGAEPVISWPMDGDGREIDFAQSEHLGSCNAPGTVACLVKIVSLLPKLTDRQRLLFLAYVELVEHHGGGSNDELREFVCEHHGLDLTVGTVKAHLNAARRRLWSWLVEDGHVPNERLNLKKARSRWDAVAATTRKATR